MYPLLKSLPQNSQAVFPLKRYFERIMFSSRGREDVQRTRTDHGLGAICGAQFRQEMLDMEFDSVQAEHQVLGDLLVGEALSHQLQDIPLPCTQRLIERRAWCWLRRGIGLGLPDGYDCRLDALKVVRRGGGKGGHPREQVRHHLAFIGKQAQIPFWLGLSEDGSQGG